MTRSRPTAALAAALALAAAACNNAKSAAPGVRLRQPSAIAAFVGVTLEDPDALRPYLAVANAARNDLAILDATDDTEVLAPIQLRGLLLPVANRPSLLASASLADEKADLLVAVSGGDSVLQVVATWDEANTVYSEPPLAVDLAKLPGLSPGDGDVLALAAVPSDPGTARIAAALSGKRVAVVTYARSPAPPAGDGRSIVLVSSAVSDPLAFQPESIAALPDDPGVPGIQTALYVATREEIVPGVRGVAELSAADLAAAPRALGARGPTRLVAAARVRERRQDSAASDASAFTVTSTSPDLRPLVPRVYAVLDESGCGPSSPIDCGIVTLDPDPGLASGAQAIPPDDAGLMPYRAPMRVPGKPLVLAVAGPPAKPPPNVAGEPVDWAALGQQYPGAFMRLYMGTIARATTGVAAVASDNGSVYYLDLGRFETATGRPIVQASNVAGTPQSSFVTVGANDERRLWIEVPPTDPAAPPAFPAADADAAKQIRVTPGFTPDENWTVSYQGTLTAATSLQTGLVSRAAEAGLVSSASRTAWIALQAGPVPASGPRTFSEVVRIWDPALGVRAAVPAIVTDPPAPGDRPRIAGDILVIEAAAVPGCVGTDPPGTSEAAAGTRREFEVEVDELLAPADAYPGGAVTVVPRRESENRPEWTACHGALVDAVAGGKLLPGLTVTVRATDLVLLGRSIGYAGRPPRGGKFTLGYSNEDALAAACPVAGWTGTVPAPACDAACRASCEALVLARKARRLQYVSVDCSTDAGGAGACEDVWPPAEYPFPLVNGPALELYVDVQQKGSAAPAQPTRALNPLTFATPSGVAPLASRGASTSPFGASGAIAFDRTPWVDDPTAGYRFLLSYPADFVLDATPGQAGAPSTVVR